MHLLHRHPQMEKRLKVPDGHVIIDKEWFDKLDKMDGIGSMGGMVFSIPEEKAKLMYGTEENRKMLSLAISMLCFKINNEIEGLDSVENLLTDNELKLLDNAIDSLRGCKNAKGKKGKF